MMNSRERFLKIMACESADRPPLFEDGIREDVLRKWRLQGLGKKGKLDALYQFDRRDEVEPNLEPSPLPSHWPKTSRGLHNLSNRLHPNDPNRLPTDWEKKVVEWKHRDYPLILRVHRGYFLSLGVHGWNRFTEAVQLLVDDPKMVEEWMNLYSGFITRLIERILRDIDFDAALFSEPIGGNHGPLISPIMYEKFVIKSYLPILDLLRSSGIKTIIYRTYANSRALLPAVVNAGFNCLWSCECNPTAMDYRDIRREFGKDLRLIGGIDSDCLRQNPDEIYRSVMQIVPQLLVDGGYIPLADGRVRDDVPFENYGYYRKLLEQLAIQAPLGNNN